jgi:hypothetical protein
MWKSFFRRAHIIGVDIQPACERFASDRVTIEIGSQENPEFLARLCAAYPPTIIIEDGSHLAHHVIYTFERMYPSLLPGGFYVAEDMHFHSTGLAEQQKTHGGPTPPDYFAAIMRSRMLVEPPPKDQYWGTQKYIFDMTDSITIIDSAVIFRKKHPRLPLEAAESFANAYMAQNTIEGDFQGRLADYYRRHWGPTDQAERAARQAVQADPDNS